ncbi:MAG: GAF domain-containing protein [Anaerolineales bacterium]|uniref:histidine kinase n=1 Tax=Candidatus Desulfolinea nitratireducens TaxID=2841698 RepID=A0A8J6NLN8_9CHLR|nr:GAF domain-containing protein [Candidatus Desulfolinea nitratireducens]MBL6959755.1 GAF domain-containing protein [Anaerolineales bacterium]
MNNPVEKTTVLHKILRRTGGLYLVIAVLFTQIFSSISTIAAEYSIQVNAEFTTDELAALAKFALLGLLIANIIVFAVIFVLYSDVRKKLNSWRSGISFSSDSQDDLTAWHQITSLGWRFSLFLFVGGLAATMIPMLLYQAFVLEVSTNQIIYTLLGAFAAILGSSSLSLLLLDLLLVPAREVLLPKGFTEGIAGAKGINISVKLQSISLALVLTSILLVAPIGYHQTVKALETGDPSVLQTMQIQSLVVAFLTIIFGIILSALFATSVSSPLQQLINTFKKIEAGDLTQRARVTATDEVGELAVYFNHMVSRLDKLQGNLEKQIMERTEQLKATSEVGRAVSSILNPEELIEKFVNLITERLGYYYAAIFIVSPDGRWAELRSATGEAGKELQAKKHRLPIAGNNMVGSAINLREARIAHDVGREAVRFDNPLLPNTRSEIALPLIVGGNVLGALDAQSTKENAFDEENIETLQGMVNQVAIALENGRLFQEAQQALKEIRTSQQIQLSDAWSGAMDTHANLEFSAGEKPLSDEFLLNIPLALRDQIIGEITLDGASDWTTEDRGWVEAVATQTALALENARLLEESQQVALQERLVAEITSKIWSSNTTDGILKTALKELGGALGASEATIELNILDESDAD